MRQEPRVSDLEIMVMVESVLIDDEYVPVMSVHTLMLVLRDRYEAELARITPVPVKVAETVKKGLKELQHELESSNTYAKNHPEEVLALREAYEWLDLASKEEVRSGWEPVEHEFSLGKLTTWDDGIEDGDGISDWWIRIDDIATPLGDDVRLCRLVKGESNGE